MVSAAQQKKKITRLHLATIYLPPDLFLFFLGIQALKNGSVCWLSFQRQESGREQASSSTKGGWCPLNRLLQTRLMHSRQDGCTVSRGLEWENEKLCAMTDWLSLVHFR